MADGKNYKIRFDKRGHIVIEDKELQQRLLWLLEQRGELVVQLDAGTPVPGDLPLPPPEPEPMPRNRICPNAMCVCGALRLVNGPLFAQQWDGIGPDGPGRPAR